MLPMPPGIPGKVEKAYLTAMPGGTPGTPGLLSSMAGALSGVAGGAAGAMGSAAALGDSLLGTGGAAGSAGGGGSFTFQFNPTNITTNLSNNFMSNPLPGRPAGGNPQYTGSNPRVLNLEALLDEAMPDGTVQRNINTLQSFCRPTPQSVASGSPMPPFVQFGWGQLMTFVAYVEKVSTNITMFWPNGKPRRAKVSFTVHEIPMPQAGTNPTSGGRPSRRTHRVVSGDTLASIAFREYRNPTLWRALADVNGIDDPMRLPPGTELFVPPASEAANYA